MKPIPLTLHQFFIALHPFFTLSLYQGKVLGLHADFSSNPLFFVKPVNRTTIKFLKVLDIGGGIKRSRVDDRCKYFPLKLVLLVTYGCCRQGADMYIYIYLFNCFLLRLAIIILLDYYLVVCWQ